MQTSSPRNLFGSPDRKALSDAFVGKPIASLRTPALVVDRATFAANCARMHRNVTSWGADFRAHIKSHKVRLCVSSVQLELIALSKTVEGTKHQLVSEGGQTHSIIVSTPVEAWKIVDGGLVSNGVVKDVSRVLPAPSAQKSCPAEEWLPLRFFMECPCPSIS